MSGLNNLNRRLNYQGGDTEGRLRQDKLNTLKKAQFNSYQAETAILADNREFKCLINPDKLKPDHDNKVLSIPYKDRCLNPEVSNYDKDPQGLEPTNIKAGDVFEWKETETHWLVFLKYLEEDAYFRAEIRRCDEQVEIGDKTYWTYVRGPAETSVVWNQKAGVTWNDLNYSLVMYITKDQDTDAYFHRFSKVKVKNPVSGIEHTWQVAVRNEFYGDGIIQLFLDESFENSIEEEAEKEKPVIPTPPVEALQIEGPREVVKYDTVVYTAKNFKESGNWYLIDNEKPEIKLDNTDYTLRIDITKSKGKFVLSYRTENEEAKIEVNIIPF